LFSWVTVQPQPRRALQFGGEEVRQILVAVGAMTLAFMLTTVGGITGVGFLTGDLAVLGVVLVSSFVAVITAFLLHELAHKLLAQRYGCFAEFRYSLSGLALGILTAAFGFLFAMPGAVVISGNVTMRQHGRISAAGPGTNLVIATAFLALALGLGAATGPTGGLIPFLIGTIAFVNLFLGGFNLVPFPPLDGSKILAASKPLWVGMVAALVAIGYTGWSLGVFFF